MWRDSKRFYVALLLFFDQSIEDYRLRLSTERVVDYIRVVRANTRCRLSGLLKTRFNSAVYTKVRELSVKTRSITTYIYIPSSNLIQ